jgi:hypothetical protein
MKEAFSKLVEMLAGAFGGYLLGLMLSVWSSGAIQSLFSYQTGWYLAYGPYLIFPVIVFAAYIFLLTGKWIIAFALVFVVFFIFVVSHEMITVESPFRFIEFVALWTLVAQLAAITSAGAWRLFWDRYEVLHGKP